MVRNSLEGKVTVITGGGSGIGEAICKKFTASGANVIIIDTNEIEDARWIGKSELLDIFVGLNQSVFPARKGSIANFLLERWLSDRLQD